METIDIVASGTGSLLRVRAKPSARRDRVAGIYDGGLKIEIAAPPEDGKANEAARRFLAEWLDVPAARMRLRSGASSRSKTFLVEELGPAALRARIESRIGE